MSNTLSGKIRFGLVWRLAVIAVATLYSTLLIQTNATATVASDYPNVVSGDIAYHIARLTDDWSYEHDIDKVRVRFNTLNQLDTPNGRDMPLSEPFIDDPATDPHSSPAWSPDGTKVALSMKPSQRSMDSEIYVLEIRNGGLVRLTENNTDDIDPTWSPDGEWIAFATDGHLAAAPPHNYGALWVTRSDGIGQPDELYRERDGNYWIRDLNWGTPLNENGHRDNVILYKAAHHDGGDFNQGNNHGTIKALYVDIERNGGQSEVVFESSELLKDTPGFSISMPDWSPDFERIVYDREGRNPYLRKNILIANFSRNGTIIRDRLLIDGPQVERSPVWSPDGTKIAYILDTRDVGLESSELIAAEVDDPDENWRLVSESEYLNDPSWQPLRDGDGDNTADVEDNCPDRANSRQGDQDRDGTGDICDDDLDGDGTSNVRDNCPRRSNPSQRDTDGDGIGDPCDRHDDSVSAEGGPPDECPPPNHDCEEEPDGDDEAPDDESDDDEGNDSGGENGNAHRNSQQRSPGHGNYQPFGSRHPFGDQFAPSQPPAPQSGKHSRSRHSSFQF